MEESKKKMREEMEEKMEINRATNDAKHEEIKHKIANVQDTIMLAIKGLQAITGSTPHPTIDYPKNVD